MKKRIVDKRSKEKFIIDDKYLNGMAKECGWKGTIVYMSLCRHSNADQECFPSIDLMATQHGVSVDTIKRGISLLKERNIIKVSRKKTKKGIWLNNSYTLIDKSEWNHVENTEDQGAVSTVVQGAVSTVVQGAVSTVARGLASTVVQGAVSTTKETHRYSKETHMEGNTSSFSAHRASRSSAPRATRSESEEGYEPLSPSGGEPNTNGQGEGLGRGRPQNEEDVKEAKKKEKEKKEKQEGRDINKIISAFLKHNPTISYVHKNNRDSAKVLLRKFGLEPTLATIEIAIACQGEIHAPLIDNPHQLRQKLAALRTFYIRTKKKNDASIMGVPDYENNKITLEDCGG